MKKNFKEQQSVYVISLSLSSFIPSFSSLIILKLCSQEEFEMAVKEIEKNLSESDQSLYQTMISFQQDKDKKDLQFHALSALQRKCVHSLADILDLEHYSTGKGKKRFIVCKRKDAPPEGKREMSEIIFHLHGFVGLKGNCVEAHANDGVELVPEVYKKNREARDGSPQHHITLIGCDEMKDIIADIKAKQKCVEVVAQIYLLEQCSRVEDDWVDLGLGVVCDPADKTNQVYFKVIDWPGGKKFRTKMGLPERTFHITIGFKSCDVHKVKKDKTTLLAGSEINVPSTSSSAE